MLTVCLPDDLDNELSSLTNDKEGFIIAAVRQKIALGKKTATPEELAKEYSDSVEENKLILEDFKHVDLENWDDY